MISHSIPMYLNLFVLIRVVEFKVQVNFSGLFKNSNGCLPENITC